MGILLAKSGGIFGFISTWLGYIMNGIYEFLNMIGIEKNILGFCIILFTIIVYTLLLPLTIKQQKFSRLSAVMNPELQAIQKKYANKKDQDSMLKMQEEQKLVYEKYGTSTFGGCLGSLIQLPILFALWPVVQNIASYVTGVYKIYEPLAKEIFELKGAKILESIGKDINIKLSGKNFSVDTIVDFLYKFRSEHWDKLADKLPELGDLIEKTESEVRNINYFFGINIAETPKDMFNLGGAMIVVAIAIPLLAGFTQWLSGRISQKITANANKNNNNGNDMMKQMNMMMNIMPLMSVFLCFTMPIGLGIYWIVSAVVRTIQQICINKVLMKKPIEVMIEENRKKAEKKRAKKKQVSSSVLNEMAQKSTRNIEETQRKTTSDYKVDSYQPDAKPGSLASKANMVRDFNNRNK